MSIIYMKSTIDNFITKGRIGEIQEEVVEKEIRDEEGNVISQYYKTKESQ